MDIFVVTLAPSKTIPAAVYGPFASKHVAHVFMEDMLGQNETTPESKRRAFVVRGYGKPLYPVDQI
jgi:hypothetical protein